MKSHFILVKIHFYTSTIFINNTLYTFQTKTMFKFVFLCRYGKTIFVKFRTNSTSVYDIDDVDISIFLFDIFNSMYASGILEQASIALSNKLQNNAVSSE